jgi:nucleotide-binding universal stress UspA family protein
MFKRILVAVNASEQAGWALDVGSQLALQLGARVGLVHVVNATFAWVPELAISEQRLLDDLRQNGAVLLKHMESRLPNNLAYDRLAREGEPSELIIAAAKEWKADLIVMGTHGRGRFAQFLLGSTAEEVLRNAPCPVLMVRDPLSNMSNNQADAGEVIKVNAV